MKYKKTIILLALVVFLLSIAGVSASEIGNTIASENANTIELSTDNYIEDNLQTSEENMVFTSTDYDEALSAQTDNEVLGEGSAKYSDLAEEIGHSGDITLTHKNYTYDKGETITISEDNKVIDGNGAVIDMNGSTIRAFHVTASSVTIKNLTIINANYDGDGGAIYFSSSATSGTVSNCNFTNNTATDGGAIYYSDGTTGEAINCNFKDNLATSSGGALVFLGTGTVTGCNFINNAGNSGSGGAIYFIKGTMSDCNFTNNKAIYGGAVYIYSAGNVANCNFVDNKAAGDYSYGGAVYFNETGTVSNCNFTNNKAAGDYSYGGAIFFVNTATVTNCNFVDNTATYNGGAIRFSGSGNVTNCNFTGNTASRDGGAIRFSGSGNVTNCNFTNNTASGDGGAVYFENSGNVTNCNFTNNTADYAGAVYFQSTGTVANCNFVDNKATGDYSFGGAIYIYSGTVTNCNFVDNKATGEYSEGGAINMDSGTVSNCNFVDNKATGDNSYGGAVFFYDEGTVSNCNFADNSASQGGAVYFSGTGNVTNCNFADNSASQGGAIYSNQQYTTADTCIFKRNSDDNVNTVIYPPTLNVNNFTTVYGSGEKLTFDLKTNSSIPVTNGNISISVYFKDNGEWVRNYTCLSGEGWIPDLPVGSYIAFFDTEYAEFQKINRTITITAPEHTFLFLNYTINGNDNPVIELSHDFYFDPAYDAAFVNGIVINRPVTIKGNGNAIDANRQARIFYVQSAYAVLENLTLKNAHSNSRGGAVYFYQGTCSVTNCNFTNNTATSNGGAVFFNSNGEVTNCNFTNNTATSNGGAVFFNSNGEVTNCNFTNNKATGDNSYGGAVRMYSGTVSNCNFINNKATGTDSRGGAVFFNREGTVSNCNFTDNTATYDGGAVFFNSNGEVTNCNFTNNKATGNGGAVYFNDDGEVTNCNFTKNSASSRGGAVYFSDTGNVKNCNFTNNSAQYGGAVHFVNNGTVTNCNFTDNSATVNGGAVYFYQGTGSVTNCNFTNNTTTQNGGAVYFADDSTGNIINCNFTNNSISGKGGAISMGSGTVSNCNFTDNKATGTNSWGGAVYFRGGQGTVTNCNFADNTATYGGAVYFFNTGNVTNCNFTNNTATSQGGAIRFSSTGTVSNCNFTDNTATMYYGGAVCFLDQGTVSNCNFTDNEAYLGGAVFFMNTGNVSNCNFTDNTASGDGGAVYFWNQGTVTNCNFTGNNATTGSAIYFLSTLAIKTVSNSRFLNNRANAEALEITKNDNNISITFTGRNNLLNAIYSSNDAEVTFTNVTYWGATGITTVSAKLSGSNKAAGQNITVKGVVNGKIIDKINGTDENGEIVLDDAGDYWIIVSHKGDLYYTEIAETLFTNMKLYANVTSLTTNNKTVNITAKSNIFSEVMPGKLLFILPNSTQIEATYGANGIWWAEHTFDAYGEYKINATYVGLDNVTINNGTITINKVNSTITLENIVLDYGETKNVTVTTTGATGITAKIDGNDVTVINNYTIQIPVLDAGTYNLTVTTIPDDDHNPVTKEVNITVNKVNSTLTVNDIVFDYGSSGSTVVSLTGADGVNATVVGQPKTVVKVNGTNITVSDLDAGTYTLTVTTIADKNHNNITKNATITVNKVNATLTVNDVVLDYGESKNITVTAEGTTGITAKIDGVDVAVNNYTILISELKAGNHTLSVTTIPDDNHNPVNVTSKITVNKVESTLTVGDIVFDYGGEGSGDVSFTGASEVTANVVNQPSAVISISGNKISVSGLAAGTYTLNVTTVPDENHTAVTETSTITVNKINSTLTLDDVVLDYGDSKNVTVTTEGATGITAKIDGVDVAVNNYTILISELKAGNHTLSVTTIPDDNHNPVNVTSKITVNKVESTLTVDDIVFDYGGEGSGDVSFTGASEVIANVVNQPSAVISISGNKISVSGLAAGTYTLNVTTVPDENHTAVTETATITVNKVNSTLTLDDVELDYGDSKNVTVTTEGATGITAKIDGVDVTVNGYTIPISGLGAGNYTLTVKTIADENHNPVTKEVNITVNKLSTEIILANETLDLKVGDEVPVLVNLTPAGAGNLTFTSSNEDLVFVEDNVTIVANSQGQAIITVSFAGNENYTAAENKTITVNVELNDASVSVENDALNLKVDETCAINATIEPDTIMLHIKYTSSNESVATVDKNGIVTAVGEGRAIITIEVGDDEIYAKNSTTVTVTVSKINTTADVSIPENITVGDNSTVNVILPADAKGNVTVKVDGEVVDTVPVKDGNADVTIPSMSAGNHTVEIAYSGDGKYNPINETKEISVSKNDITPEITIPSDIEFGDNATVDIKLPDDATGNVTLTVDGKEINTVPVTNGTASVKLPALDAGNHTAEIAYSGDDKYKSASKTTTISIDKDSTKITAADVTATYKVDKYLVITLKDSKGNPLANATVTVDLNTIKNYTADENGQIKIKVSNLLPKSYSAKITFAGNNNYLGSDATAKVVVKKATPKITASNKMFKTTTKNKKYTITLKDNTGKPIRNAKVYLKVNGKTYKATTNSKGKATFKITKLSKTGTFKATVTYKGNKYYNKASKKVTVKVISIWKTISKGSKAKSTVKEIQRALKNNGYYLTAYGHYLKVDGIYWDYTVKAVKQFQKAKGLKVTGKVDEKTAKKLGLI